MSLTHELVTVIEGETRRRMQIKDESERPGTRERAGPITVHQAGRRSGRTPALPYPPYRQQERKPRRPNLSRADHPCSKAVRSGHPDISTVRNTRTFLLFFDTGNPHTLRCDALSPFTKSGHAEGIRSIWLEYQLTISTLQARPFGIPQGDGLPS